MTSLWSFSSIHAHLLHKRKTSSISSFDRCRNTLESFRFSHRKTFCCSLWFYGQLWTGMFVVSSRVNRCMVSKIDQSIHLQTKQHLHVTISISIYSCESHISLAHNTHKWILWCIYLTVKRAVILSETLVWLLCPPRRCNSSGRLRLMCKARK